MQVLLKDVPAYLPQLNRDSKAYRGGGYRTVRVVVGLWNAMRFGNMVWLMDDVTTGRCCL